MSCKRTWTADVLGDMTEHRLQMLAASYSIHLGGTELLLRIGKRCALVKRVDAACGQHVEVHREPTVCMTTEGSCP
jgi:hypothetical protein